MLKSCARCFSQRRRIVLHAFRSSTSTTRPSGFAQPFNSFTDSSAAGLLPYSPDSVAVEDSIGWAPIAPEYTPALIAVSMESYRIGSGYYAVNPLLFG